MLLFIHLQIRKLRQENVIIEARFATFKLSTGVDELKEQVKTLKDELSTYKSKYSRLNVDYENLTDRYGELKVKSAIAQQKPSTADNHTQTDPPKFGATFVEQMDLQRAVQRAEKYKKAYEQAVTTFNELKTKYEQLEAKHIEMVKLLEEIQPKYKETKRICNYRWNVIGELEAAKTELQQREAALKAELNTLKEQLITFENTTKELDRFKRKYDVAKGICDGRRLEIERLSKIIQEKSTNNENVPQNS